MKFVLFSSFTCALILGGCSGLDPVSSNQPEAAAKRISSSLTLSAPGAGLAESRPERPRFEAGPLGAVEIGEGEAVQIRSLLAHTVAPSLGAPSRYSIELAVGDFGPVHGREVELGDSVDGM